MILDSKRPFSDTLRPARAGGSRRQRVGGIAASVFLATAALLASPPDYDDYADLLARYVEPEGVRYAAWHRAEEDRRALKELLTDWSAVDPSTLSRDAATAFLINLYNAAMIQKVLEHYPLKSVRNIGLLPFAVFRQDWIELNGATVSLDEIEKEMLLKTYFDPRIHFAVNCASVSCPPLRTEPFRASDLDAQLQAQAVRFAHGPEAARVTEDGETTMVSSLFDWYADDFPGEDPAAYLNRFRSDPLPEGKTIRWIPYNWALNESKR